MTRALAVGSARSAARCANLTDDSRLLMVPTLAPYPASTVR